MRILVPGTSPTDGGGPPPAILAFTANDAVDTVPRFDLHWRPIEFRTGPTGTTGFREGVPVDLPEALARIRSTRQLQVVLDAHDLVPTDRGSLDIRPRPRSAAAFMPLQAPGDQAGQPITMLAGCAGAGCGAVGKGAGGCLTAAGWVGGCGAVGCAVVACGAVGGGTGGCLAAVGGVGGCGAAGCSGAGCGLAGCGAVGCAGAGRGAAACGAAGCGAVACGAVACGAAGCAAAGSLATGCFPAACGAVGCVANTAACGAAGCAIDSLCGANLGWPPT